MHLGGWGSIAPLMGEQAWYPTRQTAMLSTSQSEISPSPPRRCTL